MEEGVISEPKRAKEEAVPLAKNGGSLQTLCLNMRRLAWQRIFSPAQAAILRTRHGVEGAGLPEVMTEEALLSRLVNTEVMLTGWGAVPLTEEVLSLCPDLRVVIHGAGSVKDLVTDAAQARGIRFCSAAHVNARPVAEFCLGVILMDLKRVIRFKEHFATAPDLNAAWWGVHKAFDGGYRAKKIGLVHWGRTAQALAGLLRGFEFDVYVDSKYITRPELEAFGLRRASLDWIMANCDVVSLHAAEIPETRHMINAHNLALMRDGTCLINTARGGVIDEAALIETLRTRRIWAFLDVAQREPPPPGHPFYTLPTCVLTPHVSGSIGSETERLGDYCLRELENWKGGRPLENEVRLDELASRA